MSYIGDKDFLIEVAKGNIPGHAIVNKFGRNPDVDTGTDPEDIWTQGGVWAAPTTARTHDITSTDANDDGEGTTDTGALTVTVQGLDAAGALQEETVTLNGTANVATASTYTMIYRMFVATAGSSGENEGVITATAQTDGTVTAAIAAGDNQTLMAIYKIPAAKTGYLLNWYVSANGGIGSGADVDMRLLAMPSGGVFQVKSHLGLENTGTTYLQHNYRAPPSFAALTTLKVSCETTSADNADISAGFDLLLVDN